MTLTADLGGAVAFGRRTGVREACCELMGHLREAATSAIDALMERMNSDGEDAVRDAAIDALTRLGHDNPPDAAEASSNGVLPGPAETRGLGPARIGNLIARKPNEFTLAARSTRAWAQNDLACGGRTTSKLLPMASAFARGTSVESDVHSRWW